LPSSRLQYYASPNESRSRERQVGYNLCMGEFELIDRFFKRPAAKAALGIGDDCALLQPTAGMQLAICSDMLVEGRHFLSTVDPFKLGHKALAVNLSDLAACGAQPLAFTLALALPAVDEAWLDGFSCGMFALADAHGCELIGGDTTRGPLNICITAFGEVPVGQALLRSKAQAGDDIYVSGTLGDARLALEVFRGNCSLSASMLAACRMRMEQPTPRIALGQALRGIASAAIDVSDGLLGDLGHILKASGVGARIDAPAAMTLLAAQHSSDWATSAVPYDQHLEYVLAGGDDYELVFTAPERLREAVAHASAACATPVTRIGRVEPSRGLELMDARGQPLANRFTSFDHFA
jgi:thiamine-monophosphate kinase